MYIMGKGGGCKYLGCDGEGAEVDGSGFEDLGYGGWDGHCWCWWCCGWGGGGHVCIYVGGYLRVYMYVYGVWVGGICN